MQLGTKSKKLPINKSIRQDREYTYVLMILAYQDSQNNYQNFHNTDRRYQGRKPLTKTILMDG